MLIVNLIKVAGIWLCDLINKVYYPFIETRFENPANLAMLEAQFYQHMSTSFVDSGRFKYQLPMPDDEGDAALFQGLYVSMMNLKHAERTPELADANAALGKFFVDGVLIRGYNKDGTPNDTASNDSATGMLFGLYSIWLHSTGEADLTIQRWAASIVDSGYALTDLKGSPTKYGRLEDGWKTDPLRLTLLLAILKLAGRSEYDSLYRKYKLLLKYPKVKLLWWDTDYDTHRAAIHLHVLWKLTKDPIYRDGLRRIYRITKAENNVWVKLLCYEAVQEEMVNFSMLGTFDFPARVKGNVETINSTLNGVEPVKWGDNIRNNKSLPMYVRGAQDFMWQRNMFSMDEWVGNKVADTFHSGLDFLLAYWFAVRLGLITR